MTLHHNPPIPSPRPSNRARTPDGVAVVIRASHECISSRGARMHGVSMVTRRLLGHFAHDPHRRDILQALSD